MFTNWIQSCLWNSSGGYLPRNQQYQNLLDTVYYEIQAAKTEQSQADPRVSKKVDVGMDILERRSVTGNVTLNLFKSYNEISKQLEEVEFKENETTKLTKRPRLDRQIRQVSKQHKIGFSLTYKELCLGMKIKVQNISLSLTYSTQQMSSSVSLDEGEIDNSERLESFSTSSANANEIVDDAIRHAVEGEVVRRQVASDNLFDGRLL